MRKLIALVCAIAMVMALAVPAMAAVSPDWDSIGSEESSSSSSSSSSDSSSSDSAEATEETAAAEASNLVDAAVAAQAGAALETLLNGELAGSKQLTGWLVPDLNVLKAELAKLNAADMKVVLFSNTGVASFVELTEVFAPAFNLNGVAAVTVVGK